MGFTPEVAGIKTFLRHSGGDHAKEMLRFTGFFPTSADAILEVFFRHSISGLAVVGPDARCRSDKLIDQTVRQWSLRDSLEKANDRLTKTSRPLLQVENKLLVSIRCGLFTYSIRLGFRPRRPEVLFFIHPWSFILHSPFWFRHSDVRRSLLGLRRFAFGSVDSDGRCWVAFSCEGIPGVLESGGVTDVAFGDEPLVAEFEGRFSTGLAFREHA